MGDIPKDFELIRELEEAGQGHTFVVRRANGADPTEYVLKRLKNPKREDYFNNEVRACSTLDHPNILKLVESGRTPKGKPFLLTRYCSGGSLEKRSRLTDPIGGLRLFRKIVDAIRYAHSQPHPIYHLDIKPPNIFLEAGEPIVGDFGICFIDDAEVTFTKEGHRGSLHYCAPELRDPKLKDTSRLPSADVYSLGKLLYWLFTQDVYDGHEDGYSETGHLLFTLNPNNPNFVFIDELIAQMVMKDPAKRFQTAERLIVKVDEAIRCVDARAHVLDLRIQQQCLYCVLGKYRPAHEVMTPNTFSNFPTFPPRELRRNPPAPPPQSSGDSIYERLRNVAKYMFGIHSSNFGGTEPMFLVCDHCGNVQYFRFDYTADGKGLNWLP